jgi:hypothetical protein
MALEHIVYKRETTFGTWVTPDKWLPVSTFNINSAREVLDDSLTGLANRGLYGTVLGGKPVNGNIGLPWHFVNIGSIFRSFMRDCTTTNPYAGVYDHAMLFDDTQGLLGLSVQAQHKYVAGAGDNLAINILSAVCGSMKIAMATKERVLLDGAFEAKDEAKAAGTWDWSGGASPAEIATPAYSAVLGHFMFYHAAVVIGGTPAISGGKISVGGGTTYSKINTLDISIDNGLDAEGFGLTTDPTRQEIWPGDRKITADFEISWTNLSTTFYDAWRAKTQMALLVDLVSATTIASTYKYEAHIAIPGLVLDPATLPDIVGTKEKRKQSVSGRAQVDATTAKDFGIWIRTSEATL